MGARQILGLCGLRCSGKSEVRRIIEQHPQLSVFDTNSVPTGDFDANTISADEVLQRYGGGESYLHFLRPALLEAAEAADDILVIDSVKALADKGVLSSFFPDIVVSTLWIHAPYSTRSLRYHERDITTGLRREPLNRHDENLLKLGIAALAIDADFVVSNVFGVDRLTADIACVINHLEECLPA